MSAKTPVGIALLMLVSSGVTACAGDTELCTVDLKDAAPEAKLEAIKFLGEEGAAEPLIQALRDENSSVRSHAARALGRLKDSRAVDPLITVLQDENACVRLTAAGALGNLKDD